MKKEEQKETKKKPLFTYEHTVNLYQVSSYIKTLTKHFPEYYLPDMMYASILLIAIFIGYALASSQIFTLIFPFLFWEIVILLLIKMTTPGRIRKRMFKEFSQKENRSLSIDFYQEEWVVKKDNMTYQFSYQEITRWVEEGDLFLLARHQKNTPLLILIRKENASKELLSFLEEKSRELEKEKVHQKKEIPKEQKEDRRLMWVSTILLILSIGSLPLGCYIVMKTLSKESFHIIRFFESLRYMLWMLPIPLCSFLFGWKYREKLKRSRENRIVGIGICLFLLLVSLPSFMPMKENYQKLNFYKEISEIQFPKEGKSYQNEWETTENGKTTKGKKYSILFLTEKDQESFLSQVKENENWVEEKEIQPEIKKILPFTLREEMKNKYFLIYNDTEKEYNQISEEEKTYHWIIFVYNQKTQSLEINDYYQKLDKTEA